MKARDVGLEINILSNLIKRAVDNMPSVSYASDVTGTHGWVIAYLIENRDRDIFQRDLEEKFSIRRSTATGILKLMEKNGLITRESVSHDGRLKKLILTPKAMEIHRMVEMDIAAFEQRMLQGISQQELDAFFNVVDKFKRNIE